ncbi:DUF3443 family protein [Burkholderia ubonensis]|uniref:DUF3443 family protein n=1 Tax=Burkholderia ubonensis TaxID=101571 RepID=UPI0034E94788
MLVTNIVVEQLAQCFAFANGYTWDSVRTVDLIVGRERAADLPIHMDAGVIQHDYGRTTIVHRK